MAAWRPVVFAVGPPISVLEPETKNEISVDTAGCIAAGSTPVPDRNITTLSSVNLRDS